MKSWKLVYQLTDNFSSPVTEHHFTLRCIPDGMMGQKILSCEYDILPLVPLSRGRDSFGNTLVTGYCQKSHSCFDVTVRAEVSTGSIYEKEEKSWYELGMYRYPTSLTSPGEKIRKFYGSIPGNSGEDPWERTAELMKNLYGSFCYESGSTFFGTTAEEAYSQGKGVCQDYAHILLSLCRMEQMTARYVAGAIPGEGESHAWIQVWKDGIWKGFDPTHCREVNEDYVILAVGRDAGDCCLNRGIFRGGASQQQSVHILMEEK